MPAFTATPEADGRLIRQYTLAAAQTFKLGAAVLLNASQLIIEAGADPAEILGFAQEPATKNPEGALLVLVAVASEGQRFWMAGDNDPVAADVDQTFGLVKDADGIWTVDGTDVTNTRVYVHAVDTTTKRYLVSILAANRQIAP